MKKLTGNQSKLDLNKNGKLDAEDFKMLRSNKMAKGSTVKDNRINERTRAVILKIQKTGIHPDDVSPNFVNEIAYDNGIELKSEEVVFISDNYGKKSMAKGGQLNETFPETDAMSYEDGGGVGDSLNLGAGYERVEAELKAMDKKKDYILSLVKIAKEKMPSFIAAIKDVFASKKSNEVKVINAYYNQTFSNEMGNLQVQVEVIGGNKLEKYDKKNNWQSYYKATQKIESALREKGVTMPAAPFRNGIVSIVIQRKDSEKMDIGGALADAPESFPNTDAMSYATGGGVSKKEKEVYDYYAEQTEYGNAPSVVYDEIERDVISKFKLNDIHHLHEILNKFPPLNEMALGGSTNSWCYSIGGL